MPIMEGEPHSDLTTGSNGGHTDLVSNADPTQTSSIGVRTVNGIKYLIVRIRIGGASTASKGYSLLIDTDGVFGTFSGDNPGFEKEVVLETGNNGRVAIYTHNPANQSTTLSNSYAVDEYHQRSVAASSVNSNLDYFYDFFVPLSGLGVSESDLIRFTAATITSAGSGISGTVSDFNGIDDKKYGNNRTLLMNLIINAFPAASLTQLGSSNFVFASPKTPAPAVNGGILTSSTSIAGTSTEADGTVISVYKNGTQLGSTITVSSNAWTLTGVSGLVAGDVITAKALATNKTLSDVSNSVAVTAPSSPCFLAVPSITARDNGQRRLSGTALANSTVTIFRINTDGSITQAVTDGSTGSNPTTANSSGSWGPIARLGLSQSDFGNTSYVVKASLNGCTSDYSLVSVGSVVSPTIAPEVVTTSINASTSSTSVTIKNLHNATANILFYVNGQLQETSNGIATSASTSFNYTGFVEGDIVYARAIGTATNSVLSDLSNQVTVQAATLAASQPPVITGTYTAGTGKTITGTSVEPAGTTITIYKGATLIGTITVSAFGTWQLTNQTLATNDVLTAYAKATSKSISSVSNSVTVQASAPSAPTVTGNYTAGGSSISGGNGNTRVNVYVDGSIIGTVDLASPGNWTLSNLSSTALYRGAVIHATNVVNGIESVISNTETVTGVASFVITREDGSPLGTIVSGDEVFIKIVAMNGANGSGSPFTAFSNNATLSAGLPVILGGGNTPSFSNGQLGGNGSKKISLGGAGTTKVLVSNPNDPNAFGEADIIVTEALWKGSPTGGDPTLIQAHNQAGNWTHGRVPVKGAKVKFASDVLQDMVLETEYEWESVDLNNTTSNHGKNIVLKGHNLTVKSIVNRGNSVVKTTGEGKLRLGVGIGGTVEFPVANSSNNFLKITNNTNEVDTFGVRVVDDFQTGGTTGSTVTGNFVKRTWDISKAKVNSGTGLSLEFNWTQSEEQGTQGISYDMYHHRSGSWAKEGSLSITRNGTERTGVFTGYTGTFSPFALWDANTTLPVTWLSFTASKIQEKVLLSWITGTEINTKDFEIQYSTNATNWSAIGTVLAAGNSTSQRSYSFTHTSPLKNNNYNYYRILQRDLDGKFSYSKIVSILFNEPGPDVVVYPNPVDDVLNIYTATAQIVSLYNAAGSLVWKAKLPAGRNQLPVNKFSKGVYILATDEVKTRVIIR